MARPISSSGIYVPWAFRDLRAAATPQVATSTQNSAREIQERLTDMRRALGRLGALGGISPSGTAAGQAAATQPASGIGSRA